MEHLKLAFDLGNAQLASALQRGIASEYPDIDLTEDKDAADFVLTDDFLGGPAPVRVIVERILASCSRQLIGERRPGSCRFTGFTAASGGCGVSTVSVLLGRILASQAQQRVLYLSFDPYAPPTDPEAGMQLLRAASDGKRVPLKSACAADEYGLYRPLQSIGSNLLFSLDLRQAANLLETAEDSGEWDEVILDVPRAHRDWLSLMNMCEVQVLLDPASGSRHFAADLAEQSLREAAKGSAGDGDALPALLHFVPCEDGSARDGKPDLYGPLGCEVRELAKQMARM
ncbi:MAG: hypothetical protein K5981_04030 [Clostridia bacterium]|nr:hypothetical protein [Clostridia bacterium]